MDDPEEELVALDCIAEDLVGSEELREATSRPGALGPACADFAGALELYQWARANADPSRQMSAYRAVIATLGGISSAGRSSGSVH